MRNPQFDVSGKRPMSRHHHITYTAYTQSITAMIKMMPANDSIDIPKMTRKRAQIMPFPLFPPAIIVPGKSGQGWKYTMRTWNMWMLCIFTMFVCGCFVYKDNTSHGSSTQQYPLLTSYSWINRILFKIAHPWWYSNQRPPDNMRSVL